LGHNVLDFGGGVGYFSQAAREAGFHSITFDPFSDFNDHPEHRHWDSIVALHVLEHANNLDRICQSFNQILSLGGNLILAVPNFAGRGYRELGMHWVWAQPPLIHIHHFTPQSLISLLTRHGFGKFQVSFHERWDANNFADVDHAARFRRFDSLWSIRGLNKFRPFRSAVAAINTARRFAALAHSHPLQPEDASEIQISATLLRHAN
jgi:SAM-dependent methyltransferase